MVSCWRPCSLLPAWYKWTPRAMAVKIMAVARKPSPCQVTVGMVKMAPRPTIMAGGGGKAAAGISVPKDRAAKDEEEMAEDPSE